MGFVKMLGKGGVQGAGGFQIMAEWFFDNDARLVRHHVEGAQLCCNWPEQRGANRKVEGSHNIVSQLRLELGPAKVAGGVDGDIFHKVQECVAHVRRGRGIDHEFVQRMANHRPEFNRGHVATRGTNNAGFSRHLALGETAVQSRQNLATRQIARCTKDDEVEWINRNYARNHDDVLQC